MLELHIPVFAPPYASEISSLLSGGFCPPEDTVERDPQFLSGDRRFYEGEDVHID